MLVPGATMTEGAVKDSTALVRQMDPELTAGRFAFATFSGEPPAALQSAATALFREPEALSLIVDAEHAPAEMPMRMIRLRVHSALDGVGLTAAVSGALAQENIPANVVAGYHHDHIFVPEDLAEQAMAVLRRLAAEAGQD
ncbi:ACT domain-containing protein [Pseudoruegeria sp. HB172150]|uniref:ACT domain-containing protein n=1 Tax=Pseudoruegeria sp. HB172150 TaxID=2721164 RepID=UPI001C131395|nr:ACT domain-containing protein [Pseudoruegeria sp. HB172150]